ncbi:MAG: NAD(P)/FAD-dependent oxidoreductase [Saprospiraceae bacterium]
MIQNLYDVIVIGSGPAGCAAAGICTRAGLNVLIVTDQPKPDPLPVLDPAPLESIHPGVSSLLDKIGLAGAELQATCAFYSGIYSNDIYAQLGEDSTGIWQGMHINREKFNTQLLIRIQDLGVAVMFNEKVHAFISEHGKVIGIKTASKDLYAKYIIDASGKKSVAGKKLKYKQQFFSPPLVSWTGISDMDDSFTLDRHAAHFIPHKNGWTWLAPQPPDYCAWTRLSIKGENNFLPPDELKDQKVIGNINVANMRWRLFRPVCSEGILLCGDAAGILDPAAGQGIFNALLSGIQAGTTAVKCIRNSDLAAFHLAHYDDWFAREFEGKVGRLKQYYKENNIQALG